MPGLDGVGFLAEARTLFPNAKRALLTAYADTDAAIAAINQSQVDYYLQKPWDPPDQTALSDRRRAARRLARRRIARATAASQVIGSRFMPAVHSSRTSSRATTCRTSSSTSRRPTSAATRRATLAAGADAAAGDPAGRRAARSPVGRRRCAEVGLHVEATGDDLRRRHRRRRSRRPGGRGLRGVGGTDDDPARSRGARADRPALEPDRELPGLSRRHLRRTTWRAAR